MFSALAVYLSIILFSYERVTSLKEINPDLKVLLGVNGWHARFSEPSLEYIPDPDFIRMTIKFLRDREFDGLDLDGEYVTGKTGEHVSKESFTALVKVCCQ